MSSVEMFYFTDECSECKHDTLLTLELEQGDIRFRCPHCDAEVDHDVVVACDRKYLRDQGWFVKET
jgi:DNA-directed RNA polymerase subunit RPC12/RpoP